MIDGVVNAVREAIIELTVLGPAGQAQRVAFVVDTGFDGGITLPSTIAAERGLVTKGVASPYLLTEARRNTTSATPPCCGMKWNDP